MLRRDDEVMRGEGWVGRVSQGKNRFKVNGCFNPSVEGCHRCAAVFRGAYGRNLRAVRLADRAGAGS